MIECSKCNELKEDNQYATYFHRTQARNRTRKICRVCFNLQKVQYRLNKKKINSEMIEVPTQQIISSPVEDLTPQTKLYKCTGCKELKPKEDFYVNKRGTKVGSKSSRCKICAVIYSSKYHEKKMEQRSDETRTVLPKPNTYQDDAQKDITFKLMEAMGWTFNDNGVWSKEGVKDKDKNWAFKELPTYVAPPLLRIRKKGIPTHPAFNHVDEINELRKKGYTYLYLCRHFKMSKPTLSKILKLDGKKTIETSKD
jgi:hypothetical protein